MGLYICFDEGLSKHQCAQETQSHAEHPARKERAQYVDGGRTTATAEKQGGQDSEGGTAAVKSTRASACRDCLR